VAEYLRVDEIVVQDRVGPLQALDAAERDEPGVTGAGADEVDTALGPCCVVTFIILGRSGGHGGDQAIEVYTAFAVASCCVRPVSSLNRGDCTSLEDGALGAPPKSAVRR
jgi:hypothetical protein